MKGEIISLSTDTKSIYLILHVCFTFFKYVVNNFLVSAIFHYICLLRHLPKSYFKISTFQPNFLCYSSFKYINWPTVTSSALMWRATLMAELPTHIQHERIAPMVNLNDLVHKSTKKLNLCR